MGLSKKDLKIKDSSIGAQTSDFEEKNLKLEGKNLKLEEKNLNKIKLSK